MKKLISILTAIVLILSASLTVFAQVYTEGYLHYTISDESITITGYFGDEETVTIPAIIAGIPVNTVASGAFTGSGIKELNLPDTITDIESGAIDAGVVINYNSNLPSGGQEQTQFDPARPDPTQPDSPDTEDKTKTEQPPQGESQSTKPAQPDDSKSQPSQSNRPDNSKPQSSQTNQPDDSKRQPSQTNRPDNSKLQSSQTNQPDDRRSQPSQTNQPGQPAATSSTEPTNGIEEVEIDLEKTEAVTVSPAEEIPDSTKETEAAPEAVTKPAESSAPKPFAAVIAVVVAAAVLALGGVLVWKKKK